MNMNAQSRGSIARGVMVGVALIALAGVAGGVIWLANGSGTGGDGPNEVGGGGLADGRSLEELMDEAGAALVMGDAERAIEMYGDAVKVYPEDQALRLAYANALATGVNGAGRFDEAYEQQVSALVIGPREAAIEFSAGTLASAAGKIDRSIEHYAAASTAEPGNAKYALYYGLIQFKMDELEAATVTLLRVIKLDEDYAIAWGTLSQIELRKNRSELALQHVAKARDLAPEALVWRLVQARALKRLGRVKEAVLVLGAVEPAELFELPVVRLLCESYGMLDEVEQAADLAGRASDARVGSAELAYEAAVWSRKAGRGERAMVFARRARSLGHAGADRLIAAITDDG